MMLVTTPTNNTGCHVVETLLKAGQKLRLFVRDANKLSTIGIKAAFFCVPQSSDTQDTLAYHKGFSDLAVDAVKTAVLTFTLGKPSTFTPITGEEYKQMLIKFGFSEAMVQSLKEIFDTIHDSSIGDETGTAHVDNLS